MLKQIIIAVFLLITGVSLAQEGTTSPYSFYGIGTLKFKGTVENRAMGGLSIYSDSIHLNLQNPAGMAELQLVNYSVGASHKYVDQSTTDANRRASTTSLDYLAIGIPMGKLGVGFGLIPYTSVGYSLRSEDGDTTTDYTGSGGLNKAFLSMGYKVTPKLNIGAEVNYNFGNIENTTISDTGVQYATREINRSDLLGFSFNFGASYKTMVSENLELSTSLTYTPETNFNAENSRFLASVLLTDSGAVGVVVEDEIPVDDTDFTFPSQFTIGSGLGKPKNWFVGLEYTNQKTSNFTNRTFEISDVTFEDAAKYRLGGFYIPNYNSIGNYWKRVVYRAGIRYEETGINISGQGINEFGISFGVGLPVGRVFSNVNLGFEVGRRGTKDFGLIQENFFNTFLSLSLNDKWFEKRYYD
ncbi:hypothetical protein ATE92_0652 [Ulvibacter sp. MAR_2010_11]|uniref:hypothetical protein n=1 Tax=Ulvibacter sp. MAR_2010_11 TaxID=1250229 RepID=UPI000C2C03A6|nr:hypothetical protein [Ulvibacter sp. MAR_2010_11]PKA82522.1 hypothetical protein ATE92_0652 [Ulvibacter sp. MAR_2010_11]